jgi:DNA-binding GntR family transcriptional regulator
LLVIHDASSHFRIVREAVLRLEEEGLISAVLLSTPRGVAVAQRREGRR